jgi:chromosome segregation ATPase
LRLEITGLRADNAQNKAALQEKARKNVEEVQRNEDMARMLTELVQSNDEKSKDVLQKGPIQEFHHKDLVQLSKAQLLALAQISAVKYIYIKRKLQNEQALQQEVGELKQKLATITQARDDLESNMFLQNKYLQKMQKQIAQVENYRSTISMQEKVIAKMQSVVESMRASAGGMNLINSKAGAFPTKPVATGSTVSPLTNARNQQLDNNSNNNHNLESERIQQELQEAKNKNSELQQELENKRQSLDYANEDVRLLQEDVAKLKQV